MPIEIIADIFRSLGPSYLTGPIYFNTSLTGIGIVPTIAGGTGAGVGATVSIVGTDTSGTITVITSVADTPAANADIATITFSTVYGSAPKIIIETANDTSANLTYGIWRYRQSDTTTTLFKIRSGATPLPATTAATYIWNYMVIE